LRGRVGRLHCAGVPDMIGLEFLAVATQGELPCDVVLLTRQRNETIPAEAMRRSVHDCLLKDQVVAGRLWRAIAGALPHAQLRANLAAAHREPATANAAPTQGTAIRKAVEANLQRTKASAGHVV